MILHRESWKPARWAGTLLGAALIAASAGSVTAPAAAAPASPARPAAGANPSQLGGVFCTSAADCWAVGATNVKGAWLNRVLHWTGQKWFKVAVPSPAGTAPGDLSKLVAVRCTTAANCWAVGDAQRFHGVDRNQALHWNGKRWLVVKTPSPGAAFNALSDVACTSPTSCWAVGTEGPIQPAIAGFGKAEPAGAKFFQLNEILHWNGKRWTVVPAPNPGGTIRNAVSELVSVRCTSAADCWAAGFDGSFSDGGALRNQMLHWSGTKWVQVRVPDPAGTKPDRVNEIFGLSCTSPGNCWAAGNYGRFKAGNASRFLNEILHWNGSKWFNVRVLNPDGTGPGASNALEAINCSSATDCWAVGDSGGGTGKPQINQALHWNGAHWSKVSTPNPGGMASGDNSVLRSVRCTGAANCWAVGGGQKRDGTESGQILHWTGKRWFVS